MTVESPLYLHFLDRELANSVNYAPTPEVVQRVLKILLLGSTAPLYCGLSLLWESPGNAAQTRQLTTSLLASGILDAVTDQPTLDEFLSSRQQLYSHDQGRYPMYFGSRSYSGPPPTSHKMVSTTSTLARTLAERFADADPDLDSRLSAPVAGEVRARTLQALAKREHQAITYSFLAGSLGDLSRNRAVEGSMRRVISALYTRHYLELRGGDIATGITGLSWFDQFATAFPTADIVLIDRLLQSAGCALLLAPARGTELDFWLAPEAWRGQYIHAEVRTEISLLLQVLVILARRNWPRQAGANDQAGLRGRALSILQKCQSSPTTTSSRAATDILESTYAGTASLSAELQRDRDFAMEYRRLRSREDPVDVLVLTATTVERDAVIAQAGRGGLPPRVRPGKTRTYFELGNMGGNHVVLVQCEVGSGTVGGSIVTAREAIAELQPRAVIMVGIAFGVRPDEQRITDVLVSTQVIQYEPSRIGTNTFGGLTARGRGDRATASPMLLSRMRAATSGWTGPRIQFGPILSGEKLVDHEPTRDSLVHNDPDAIGGDMEASGLYVAAVEARLHWIIAKAICDWADGHKADDKLTRQASAANASAAFVIRALGLGPLGTDADRT
jgi:nucleoside phosphorylase